MVHGCNALQEAAAAKAAKVHLTHLSLVFHLDTFSIRRTMHASNIYNTLKYLHEEVVLQEEDFASF